MVCALLFASQLKAETRFFAEDEEWAAKVEQMPPQVQKLMHAIKSTDMHPYLLSELKNHRLLVTHVDVLENSLVVIDIEEGHGQEKVVFDFEEGRGWTIIRRSPVGDWKPKEQRRGDRLTHIPFPTEPGASQPSTKKS